MSNDELQHYGVKGMKWGVRRNTKLLANHKRNQTIKKARSDYKKGRISKTKKNITIEQAKIDRKNTISKTKKKVKGMSKDQLTRYSDKLKVQTVKDVPHSKLKKGARTVSNILARTGQAGGLGMVGVGALVAASASGLPAPLAVPVVGAGLQGVGAGAYVTTAIGGANWVKNKLLDRLD